ncbi:hypothetical protein D516_0178 [Rhodobacter sp. AKP1]|nr:hypothetical protein D516_0178 [Rhodobacter sp. AKP1]
MLRPAHRLRAVTRPSPLSLCPNILGGRVRPRGRARGGQTAPLSVGAPRHNAARPGAGLRLRPPDAGAA